MLSLGRSTSLYSDGTFRTFIKCWLLFLVIYLFWWFSALKPLILLPNRTRFNWSSPCMGLLQTFWLCPTLYGHPWLQLQLPQQFHISSLALPTALFTSLYCLLNSFRSAVELDCKVTDVLYSWLLLEAPEYLSSPQIIPGVLFPLYIPTVPQLQSSRTFQFFSQESSSCGLTCKYCSWTLLPKHLQQAQGCRRQN